MNLYQKCFSKDKNIKTFIKISCIKGYRMYNFIYNIKVIILHYITGK